MKISEVKYIRTQLMTIISHYKECYPNNSLDYTKVHTNLTSVSSLTVSLIQFLDLLREDEVKVADVQNL